MGERGSLDVTPSSSGSLCVVQELELKSVQQELGTHSINEEASELFRRVRGHVSVLFPSLSYSFPRSSSLLNVGTTLISSTSLPSYTDSFSSSESRTAISSWTASEITSILLQHPPPENSEPVTDMAEISMLRRGSSSSTYRSGSSSLSGPAPSSLGSLNRHTVYGGGKKGLANTNNNNINNSHTSAMHTTDARLVTGVTSIDLDLIASVSHGEREREKGGREKDRAMIGLDGISTMSSSGKPLSPSSSVSGDETRTRCSTSSREREREREIVKLPLAVQTYLKTIPNLSYMLAPPGFEDVME